MFSVRNRFALLWALRAQIERPSALAYSEALINAVERALYELGDPQNEQEFLTYFQIACDTLDVRVRLP
jgi:hypothetical protein